MKCIFCTKDVHIKGKIGRNDTCPNCQRDLRCCRQCNFYDQDAYNGCREVAAERIVEKERTNFCDFFIPNGSKAGIGSIFNRTREAREALEALFKK
jgi:hypothetical protein